MSGGAYTGHNGPNGRSDSDQTMNGGYPNGASGTTAPGNNYGNANQNFSNNYGYAPNGSSEYYSGGFDGVPQEHLPFN